MSLSYNTVAIFAGSDTDHYHLSFHAQRLGRELARRTVELVCNGSGTGLSQEFFSAALCEDGHILKLVAPEQAATYRSFYQNMSMMPIDSAQARKKEMIARAEAIFVLPTGLVTKESDTVLTPKDLANGAGEKPVIFLDFEKHFAPLKGDIAAHKKGVIEWAGCVDEAMDIFDWMRVHPEKYALKL